MSTELGSVIVCAVLAILISTRILPTLPAAGKLLNANVTLPADVTV